MKKTLKKKYKKYIEEIYDDLLAEFPDYENKVEKAYNDVIINHQGNGNNVIHSTMELIFSVYMISKGYDVEVEKLLQTKPELLICDLYGTNGDSKKPWIVEVENTGVPGKALVDKGLTPEEYTLARTIGKIVRYSKFAGTFSLAYLNTPRPNFELLDPIFYYFMSHEGVDEMDIYDAVNKLYNKPRVRIYDIRRAHLDSLYLINIDKRSVKRIY